VPTAVQRAARRLPPRADPVGEDDPVVLPLAVRRAAVAVQVLRVRDGDEEFVLGL